MRLAVVGAGIMGLSTARTAAERGHDVTVFEQAAPGHPGGSTAGRSRIVRQSYPDAFYTEPLLEGHALWHELEAASGRAIVHPVGLLYVGPRDEPEIAEGIAANEGLGVAHEVLGPAEIGRRHPTMRLDPGEVAVWTAEAGWADVPAALEATRSLAERAGAMFVHQKVEHPAELPGFDRVVVTAGAWVTCWAKAADAIGASSVYGGSSTNGLDRLRVTRQTFAYLDRAMEGPVWIEGFGDHLYGFPSEPGRLDFKAGFHTPGPETEPDDPDRSPIPSHLAAIRAGVERRFGAATTVTEAATCLYTTAPNDDFKIGWLTESLLLASPCSGHGFKFGPWMGRFLVDVLEGREDLVAWPRWHWRPSAS
jgi:glycine/D-amino acid oxidase-like deaminating enzyme